MLPTKRAPDGQYAHSALPVKVVGLDITYWPKLAQFSALCVAVFVFYLAYGYMQELIFRLPVLSLLCTFFFELKATCGIVRRIPWKVYFQLAFYTVATMGLSNASVGYLNYPTQVIFKCCKLIPVLIGGILIQHKRYGIVDFAAASLMSLGLVMFSLADSSVSGALFLFHRLRVYFSRSRFVGRILLCTAFFLTHPLETYGYSLIYAFLGYVGVNVVLTLVRTSGALVAVTVTTMRKAVTIIFSFYFFAKPFTIYYVWAGLVVLLAIYLSVYSKNKKIFDSKLASWWSSGNIGLRNSLLKKDFDENRKLVIGV
uniref:Adenosine 3'-phospho 5'-phosphosulfate transporter 2 n=1 Tax=Ditylenchus dipsaci TaxID=166011 RepID=A0A915E060_9BILA